MGYLNIHNSIDKKSNMNNILNCKSYMQFLNVVESYIMADLEITEQEFEHIKLLLSQSYNFSYYSAKQLFNLYTSSSSNNKAYVIRLIDDVLDQKLIKVPIAQRDFINPLVGLFIRNNVPLAKKWILHKNSPKSLHKELLAFDYSLDEEILALKSMSTYTYNANMSNYIINPKALRALSPIARLQAITALLNIAQNNASNPFKHITEDDLDIMLAPAVIRHPAKVSEAKQRFNEVVNSNEISVASIKFNCASCGEIKVNMESKIIKSEYSFKKSRLYKIAAVGCLVCGRYIKAPSININE